MKTLGAPILSLCAALALGCTDSHVAGDGGPNVDAGPRADSGVVPGDDGGPIVFPDGSMFDAGAPTFDAGTPTLDGGTPVMDGGSAPDAGGSLPDGGGVVTCGTMTCSGTQICCVTRSSGMTTQECVEPAACMGATITCDGPEDCTGGDICCGGAGSGSGTTMCQDAATTCRLRVCHVDADCPMGNTCCPFMTSGICSSFGCF